MNIIIRNLSCAHTVYMYRELYYVFRIRKCFILLATHLRIYIDESPEVMKEESDGNSDDRNAIVISIIVVAIVSIVLVIIIIVIIIYVKHRHLHKSHGK